MALSMDLVPPRIRVSRRQMFQTEHALSLAESKLRLRQANHSALLEAIGDLYLIRRPGNVNDNFDHALSCFRKASSLYSKDSFSYVRVSVKIACTWYVRLRSLKYLSDTNITPLHLEQAMKALEFALKEFEKQPPAPNDLVNSRAYTIAHYCRTLLYEELYYYTLNNQPDAYILQQSPSIHLQSISDINSLQQLSSLTNSIDLNKSTTTTDDSIDITHQEDIKKQLDTKKNIRLTEILKLCLESSEKTLSLSEQLVAKEIQLDLPNTNQQDDEQYEQELMNTNVIIKLDEEKLLQVSDISDEDEIALFVPSPSSAGLTRIEKARCMVCYASAVGMSQVRRSRNISKALEYLSKADNLLADEGIYIEQANNLKYELDRQMETLTEANRSTMGNCIVC